MAKKKKHEPAEEENRSQADMNRDALQAIADVLSGQEWNVDSFDQIAGILTGAGYEVKDLMKDEDED